MTPDGISDDDWDRVHELAVDIVNAGEGEESIALTGALLAYMDRLEEKYGQLPSIVATRADYVEDPLERLALLEHAYGLALEQSDRKNLVLVASSLVSLHIETVRDADQAERWLRALQEALKYSGDDSDIREYERLSGAVERLRGSE